MIRFRLSELISDAQFKTGRRITLLEISRATGINRMTLSRMTNLRGYSTSTDTIDKLCKYFVCDVADVARYVDDPTVERPSRDAPTHGRTPVGASTRVAVKRATAKGPKKA